MYVENYLETLIEKRDEDVGSNCRWEYDVTVFGEGNVWIENRVIVLFR